MEPLRELHQLPPTEFEEVVASLLRAMGYQDVQRIGGANDQGVDILCIDSHGIRVAVQCKRYALESRIGAPAVQHLSAMAVRKHAHRCIFVTTADYTTSARRQAEDFDVELIAGVDLLRLLDDYPEVFRHYGIGAERDLETLWLEDVPPDPIRIANEPSKTSWTGQEPGQDEWAIVLYPPLITIYVMTILFAALVITYPNWDKFPTGMQALVVFVGLPVAAVLAYPVIHERHKRRQLIIAAVRLCFTITAYARRSLSWIRNSS